MLDAHFANLSWERFKETLQIRSRNVSIENLQIFDQFPALPMKPPKMKEKPYKSKLHTFMRDHRTFITENSSYREKIEEYVSTRAVAIAAAGLAASGDGSSQPYLSRSCDIAASAAYAAKVF